MSPGAALVARDRPHPRHVLGPVLRVTAALLIIALLVVVPPVAYAVLTPYTGVPVPAACDAGTAGPGPRPVSVPAHGEGTIIAADGPTTVVVVPAPDGQTAGGSVLLVAGGDVVFSLPIGSRAVAAGVGHGRAYVFDDKIGYILDSATGVPLPRLLTVDNYRGLYMADGVEHVQTSIDIAVLGSPGQPFVADSLPFGAVVDGCLVATAIAP